MSNSPRTAAPASRQAALPGIAAIVAVSSAKGGVGKSTVTVNLAMALKAMGKAVGILDADILGPSVPGMLGIDADSPPRPGPNGKVSPANGHGIKAVSMALFSGDDQPMMLRGPMVGKYLNLFLAGVDWGPLDVLLLDLPPGTGDIQLNIAQAFPLTGAIIVTTPQAVSTKIARRGARMFETVQTPLFGVVENMRTFTCPTCGSTHDLFGQGGGERLAGELGIPFLGALPLDPAVIEAGDAGLPLLAREVADSDSASAYRALAARIVDAVAQAETALPPFRWAWETDEGAPVWDEAATSAAGAPDVPAGLSKTDAHTLSILWQDGVAQDIDVPALRLSCGCALCRDEMTGRPLLDPASVPGDIRPVEIRNIGRYAIGLTWSDGHSSGIHPYAALRSMAGAPPPDARCPASEVVDIVPSEPVAPRTRDQVIAAVQDVLDGRFSATVARHGGRIRLVDFADGRLSVEMGGRCQGCAASQLTLRAGLAATLRGSVPEVVEIVDVTDHARGENPYFPPEN